MHFNFFEKANLRDVEINGVTKMMTCKDADRGFFTYYCENWLRVLLLCYTHFQKNEFQSTSSYLQRSITQTTFDNFIKNPNKWAPNCPKCGSKMKFDRYEKGPPKENEAFGNKLGPVTIWGTKNQSIISSNTGEVISTPKISL